MARSADQIVFAEPNRVILHTISGPHRESIEVQGETTVEHFMATLHARSLATESTDIGLIPPDLTVRAMVHENGILVLLIEIPPGLRTIQWLRDDSLAVYGSDARYCDVHIALPWQYFFVSLKATGESAHHHSLYFLTRTLRSLDEPLLEPHFRNCSPTSYGLYCWVCSQSFPPKKEPAESLAEFAHRLAAHFFSGGFNLSSEHAEGASFWSKNCPQIRDARVTSIAAWEAASRADPDFVLQVPWIQAPRTAREVFKEITRVNAPAWPPTTVSAVAQTLVSCFRRK